MNKLVLLTGAVAFSAVSFGTTTVASVQNTPVYYLSLGDSLSVGIQPNQSDLHRPFPFIGAGGFGGALSQEGFSDQWPRSSARRSPTCTSSSWDATASRRRR